MVMLQMLLNKEKEETETELRKGQMVTPLSLSLSLATRKGGKKWDDDADVLSW